MPCDTQKLVAQPRGTRIRIALPARNTSGAPTTVSFHISVSRLELDDYSAPSRGRPNQPQVYPTCPLADPQILRPFSFALDHSLYNCPPYSLHLCASMKRIVW
ncbi:hypothetical protein AMAG_19482 [Allomyces macrogynus ATCC 38327]|uniref:Uncharacterized protein n=1 Tax=Allomyces macrogynus (strain ATCC 38327) TaxID=578462 RepID=A0A0L0ST67_ALLM3|nr:hypothetical protein AMAG_19482 [Allomyces macrogynus ATCC 38327]|eukprot:KNE65524.1 hypothetical protein AMAG_19482 [Allomyces macrogynus ATCC 38327]